MSELKNCRNCGRTFSNDQDFLRHSSRWRKCDQGNLWFNCECGSTLMVQKGQFPWYDPKKNLSPDAAYLFNKLSITNQLPVLSNEAMRLQEIVDKPNVSSSQIAEVVRNNPTIAGDLLKLSNNLNVAATTPIRSLEHAVSLVGRKTVKDLALISAMRRFPFKTKIFNSNSYWRHALLAGMISELIARELAPGVSSDEAYVAGCLANIGKIAQSMLMPDQVDQWFNAIMQNNLAVNWRQLEFEVQAPPHTILGEIAAALWGLPDFVIETAINHHNLNKIMLKGQSVGVQDVVAAAIQLANSILYRPGISEQIIIDRFCKFFNLSDDRYDALFEQAIKLRQKTDSLLH